MPYRRGEVYYVTFRPRQHGDSVIEGPHYAVVVQSDRLSSVEGYNNLVVVPFTSQDKGVGSHYRVEPTESNGFGRPSFAMCEQVITISVEFVGADRRGSLTEYDTNQIAARAAVFALGLPVKALMAAGLIQG